MEERIELLNKGFSRSISLIELNVERKYFLGISKALDMLRLNLKATEEINKRNPDLILIDSILLQIEIINSQPLPKFESGAVPKPN